MPSEATVENAASGAPAEDVAKPRSGVSRTVKAAQLEEMRRPDFDRPSGYNIRDIAEVEPQRLRHGQVFRSSEIFNPQALQSLRIQSAIDLRKAGRRDSRAAKRGKDPKVNALDRSTDDSGILTSKLRRKPAPDGDVSAGKDTLSNQGITVFNIELLPPRAKLKLLWMAPRPAKWRLMRGLLTCASPQKIMAPVVADPNQIGYGKLYCLMLDYAQPLICRALKVFSHARNLPAVVHCTHGKDRTGLLVALLLLLLGVSQKAVVRDYVLSEKELKVKRENVVGDGHISGDMVDSELITSSGTIITQALRHLEERYGGALAYARTIGLGEDKIRDIRHSLLKDQS